MHWFNVYLPNFRTEPYTDATPDQYGTFWRLIAFCIEQENYGRIAGATKWSERKWLLTIGGEGPGKENSPLWEWRDGDLHIHGYPNKQQRRRDSKAASRERVRKCRELKRHRNGSDSADETPVKREALH